MGDVGEAIKEARPDSLTKLYRELGIEVSCRQEESGGEAVISLVVANVRVRGGVDYRFVTSRARQGVMRPTVAALNLVDQHE
jgi:hypothetical protein